MSNNPYQDLLNKIQQTARSRGGGGFPGGRPPIPPRGLGPALTGFALLGGGAWVLSNSLFNVDGGHRAIKYRRLNGVSKEIYGEGSSAAFAARSRSR